MKGDPESKSQPISLEDILQTLAICAVLGLFLTAPGPIRIKEESFFLPGSVALAAFVLEFAGASLLQLVFQFKGGDLGGLLGPTVKEREETAFKLSLSFLPLSLLTGVLFRPLLLILALGRMPSAVILTLAMGSGVFALDLITRKSTQNRQR